MIDAAEFYQDLKANLKDAKPFVAYSKPGNNHVKGIFQKNSETYRIQDMNESGFIFAPFNPEDITYFIPAEHSEVREFQNISGDKIDSDLYEYLAGTTDFEYMEEDQKAHEQLVQKGIDSIKSGDLKKVVLARSESVQVHDPDPIRIFKKLLNKYSEAFVYLWYHPKTGCWLGATPEALVSAERKRFSTMALAGTQLFKGDTNVDWDTKEVEEQLFVTDYILESLNEVKGITNLEVSRPYSAKAGNLLHIKTDISGNLENSESLAEIIKVLHPTPAVCGLPKQKALQFILDNENRPREYYSGYLGELNLKSEIRRSSNARNQENQQFASISKKTDIYVNLRCMKMKDGFARLYIGGGITKDSNAADEWMETVNKSQTMKAVLVK